MSALYNRRRGAKSYLQRKPRQCAFKDEEGFGCILLARVNRYCQDHQTVKR
jgi:hypothetical protein